MLVYLKIIAYDHVFEIRIRKESDVTIDSDIFFLNSEITFYI